jgi:hypothetical protein
MEARAETRQEKADARAEARHAEMLALFRGSTTCATEMTSSSEKMKANQAEMEAKSTARVEKATARHSKADAIMRSISSDLDRILQQQIEAWKGTFLSSEERTKICGVPPVACPDNSEDNVITFEQNSEEIDVTRLKLLQRKRRLK